jgi:hypothetical protein
MSHDLGMKSRVHPKYKTKYRVGNWAEYDRALVQRGDITLWISTDATDAWKPALSGTRGGQRKFSDHAIETALMLRLVFTLPLRQAEGFLRSILSLMSVDLEAPDHTPSPGGVSTSKSISISSRPTSPSISSSTAQGYPLSAKASGRPSSMEDAASVPGRNSISVSIDRV